MKTLRSIVLTACSLLLGAGCFAQDEGEKKNNYDPENWFTGGSVSLGLANGYFNVGLHPHYGYTVAKWIDFAGVVNFEYESQRDLYYNNKYRTTVYGLGVFTRIYPVHFLFVQAQPEYNFIAQKSIPNTGTGAIKTNFHVPSVLVGGGYTTSRSDKNSFTYLSVLVDVVKNINSPYVDYYGNLLPIIRAGINIGLNRSRRK